MLAAAKHRRRRGQNPAKKYAVRQSADDTRRRPSRPIAGFVVAVPLLLLPDPLGVKQCLISGWRDEWFRRIGAKSVVVADGPGHQRDAQLVLSQSGHQQSLREERIRFIDLNRDELVRTPLQASYTGMKYLWLPARGMRLNSWFRCPRLRPTTGPASLSA